MISNGVSVIQFTLEVNIIIFRLPYTTNVSMNQSVYTTVDRVMRLCRKRMKDCGAFFFGFRQQIFHSIILLFIALTNLSLTRSFVIVFSSCFSFISRCCI